MEASEIAAETVDLYLDLASEVAVEPLGSAAVPVKGQEMTAHLLRHLGICPKSFSLEQSLILAIEGCGQRLSIGNVAIVMWL